MNKRQLGNTNINLTAIGFGGAPLGNLFENLDERNCYDILEKTYNEGINIYDTSPLYGYGSVSYTHLTLPTISDV